jgi:hypothetical protein
MIFSRVSSSRSSFFALIAVVGLAVAIAGCSVAEQAARTTVGSASEAAGEQVGQAIGQQIASSANLPNAGTAQWNRFMASQAQVLFNYAFAANGMWPAEANYEPGEWVQYEMSADGEGQAALQTLERAFLKTTEDGQEWWRVKAQQEEDTWVYEALLDPERGEVVRLRSKDPEGNVGEVPVTERTVYQEPQQLTEESVEGATVGEESVDTPTGTFTARKVQFQGGMGGGNTTWFLSEEVPGHVVQYRVQGNQGDAWISTLSDYGSDTTTTLDSY